jgi:hypothetical protein
MFVLGLLIGLVVGVLIGYYTVTVFAVQLTWSEIVQRAKRLFRR